MKLPCQRRDGVVTCGPAWAWVPTTACVEGESSGKDDYLSAIALDRIVSLYGLELNAGCIFQFRLQCYG